jgi:DNA polymerase elongation subunit (family B)
MFYTNVQSVGNYILYRGVKDGRRFKQRIEYQPTLYVPAKKITSFTSLKGEYLEPINPGGIRDAREFVKKYSDVDGFRIFGNTRYEYAFIADEHPGMVNWDEEQVSVAVIDIEVGSENGFPDPYIAQEAITAIAIKFLNGKMVVFGCGDYKIQGNEVYVQCRDEYTLCKRFLDMWEKECPDIISGWNIKFFDIPYLVNRFRRILGEDEAKRLSPWKYISERKAVVNKRELIAYTFEGVATLDYLELYRWYAPNGKSQENYRLDTIAEVELGKNKLSYDEYDNLHQLYKLNFQKFIEYNIVDVELILELEDKLKLIQLAMTIAYDTKSNFEDVFAQTRMWDSMTYSYLLAKNIIVPPKEVKAKDEAFEGAYVKEPVPGLYDWVASFDLNSLYPHLMMQYNISPETLIEPQDYTENMRNVLAQGVTVDKMLNKEIDTEPLRSQNATLTPNGQFFRTDIRGFLPSMLDDMYEDRKKFKKMALKAKQEYENETDPAKKAIITKTISRYENLQLAKKVGLNSAYGALGSQYFRFYDLRQALAVTSAGQLSIRWIEGKLNLYMNKLLKTETDYVIASDTDSIYLKLGPLVNQVFKEEKSTEKVITFMDKVCEDKLQPYIDKSYQELADYVCAYAQKMQMKREALADKGIWTAKKRYILNVYNNEGVQYKEPKVKVMGLEMIKSSTPAVVRDKMKDSIKIMINGSEEDMHKFIHDFRAEFKSMPVENIASPRGLSGLNEYKDNVTIFKKSTPINSKGALIYNHFLKEYKLDKKYPLIQQGEKIKYIFLKLPNTFNQSVIAFTTRLPKEFDIDKFVDYDLQFDKVFLEPVKLILDCIGWTTEKQSSLEDFFG